MSKARIRLAANLECASHACALSRNKPCLFRIRRSTAPAERKRQHGCRTPRTDGARGRRAYSNPSAPRCKPFRCARRVVVVEMRSASSVKRALTLGEARAVKIAIAGCGSLGDMRPLLALSCGLREAGHQVLFGGPARYRALVERLQFEFFQLGPGWDPEESRRIMAQVVTERRAINRVSVLCSAGLASDNGQLVQACNSASERIEAEGVDMVASHPSYMGARIVAELADRPWVTCTLNPAVTDPKSRPPEGV